MDQLSLTEFETSIFEIDPAKQLVNLTKIAKAFGKEVFDWKRLQSTQEFLEALQEGANREILVSVKGGVTDCDAQGVKRENPVSLKGGVTDCDAQGVKRENPVSLVTVKGNRNDGEEQGTWGNQEVAIEFAQWISPKFKVFCIKHLKRLFNEGSTSVSGSSGMTTGKTTGMESLMAEELMIQSLQRIVQVKRQMAALEAQLEAEKGHLKKIQPVGNPVLKGLEPKKGSMTGAERARNYRKRLRDAK